MKLRWTRAALATDETLRSSPAAASLLTALTESRRRDSVNAVVVLLISHVPTVDPDEVVGFWACRDAGPCGPCAVPRSPRPMHPVRRRSGRQRLGDGQSVGLDLTDVVIGAVQRVPQFLLPGDTHRVQPSVLCRRRERQFSALPGAGRRCPGADAR